MPKLAGRANSTIDAPDVEYIIAILLGPTKEPDRFWVWPPHITLIPWFYIENPAVAEAVLHRIAAIMRAFQVKAVGAALFGPRKNVPVIVLEPAKLTELHNMLHGELENVGAEFMALQYMGGQFHPHITVKPHMKLSDDDVLAVDKLFLISADPRLDRRQRLKKIVTHVELAK